MSPCYSTLQLGLPHRGQQGWQEQVVSLSGPAPPMMCCVPACATITARACCSATVTAPFKCHYQQSAPVRHAAPPHAPSHVPAPQQHPAPAVPQPQRRTNAPTQHHVQNRRRASPPRQTIAALYASIPLSAACTGAPCGGALRQAPSHVPAPQQHPARPGRPARACCSATATAPYKFPHPPRHSNYQTVG